MADIKILFRPVIFFYFENFHGHGRLFFDGDTLYCSGEMEEDLPAPEGMNEIKGSKFWMIVEKIEAKTKEPERA